MSRTIDLEGIRLLIQKHGLNTKSRKRELVYMRYVFYKFIRDNSVYSLGFIGSLFSRDHASVLHGVYEYQALKGYDDFERIKKQVEDELYRCIDGIKSECQNTNELISLVTLENNYYESKND